MQATTLHHNPVYLPPVPSNFAPTPEFRLLCACCSPHEDQLGEIDLETIDWRAFSSLAARHQVTAIAYSSLCRHAATRRLEEIHRTLKQRAIQVRGHALELATEVTRLNRAFVAQGIETIPLKGVVLSQRLFGDPAMRHAQDIDLMVTPECLADAHLLLTANGYRRTFPAPALTPRMWRRVLLQDHHFTYADDQRRIVVELHWALELWTPENIKQLWQHSRETTGMGTAFRELTDEALLLVLCSHGASHRWSRLKWLTDVTALMARVEVSWEELFAMAIQFDLERALAQAALLVHWFFGTNLCAPLRELIAREADSFYLAEKAVRAMFMDRGELRTLERYSLATSVPYQLRLKKHLPVSVPLRKIWICSSYFGDLPLPDELFWLYYPLRPCLWLRNRLFKGNRRAYAIF
jgi:hypothetical protein